MAGKYTFELIGNHPENIKMLTDTLFDIKETMFRDLYDGQKALLGLDRFDFTFDASNENNIFDDGTDIIRNRIWSISGSECVFLLNKTLIKSNMRDTFRKSEFYKKYITYNTIQNNISIFTHNVVIYVNGLLYTGFQIKPSDSYTEIIFPFKSFVSAIDDGAVNDNVFNREMFIKNVLTGGCKMTVLFIPNHPNVYETITRQTSVAGAWNRVITANLKTPINTQIEAGTVHIYNKNITDIGKNIPVDAVGQWTYVNNIPSSLTYEIDSRVVENPEWSQKWKSTQVNITSLLFSRSQKVHKVYTRYFRGNNINGIPLDLPIPVENFLVYKVDSVTGGMTFVHDTNILKLYYPDIYEITSFTNGDEYYIVSLHSDDNKDISSKYKDELSLYRKFVQLDSSRYNEDTIPDYIKNYKPVEMRYDIPNYISSDFTDTLEYKISKIKEMIYKDGDTYKLYLDKLVGNKYRFEIRCSNFTDDEWAERIRHNNYTDIPTILPHTEFDEDNIAFIINAEDNDTLLIWVDGVLLENMYRITHDGVSFIYIPVSALRKGRESVLTVEKISNFDYIKSITIDRTFDMSEYIEVSFDDKKIVPNEMYLSYIDADSVEKYIDEETYTLYYNIDGEYIELDGSEFFEYDRVFIRFNNIDYFDKTIYINITNSPFTIFGGSTNELILNRKVKNDSTNFMLFKNGLQIPHVAVNVDFSENVSGPHRFKVMLMSDGDTDRYELHYIPTKYYQVYFQNTIPSNGFVDMTGKITKPIDFKWHEIYLNGRRLSTVEVEILGPYVIKLKDVKSINNFVVYQKNLDPYIPFIDDGLYRDHTSNLIYNTELNAILRDGVIEDIEDDILADLIIDIIGFFDEYLSEIGLINPDRQQITDEMLLNYPLIFDEFNNLFMNPGCTKGLEYNVLFEPDKNTLTKM